MSSKPMSQTFEKGLKNYYIMKIEWSTLYSPTVDRMKVRLETKLVPNYYFIYYGIVYSSWPLNGRQAPIYDNGTMTLRSRYNFYCYQFVPKDILLNTLYRPPRRDNFQGCPRSQVDLYTALQPER